MLPALLCLGIGFDLHIGDGKINGKTADLEKSMVKAVGDGKVTGKAVGDGEVTGKAVAAGKVIGEPVGERSQL